MPAGSTLFQCGICLEIYDNMDDSKSIDKCNGCQCALCINCNIHAYMVAGNNHCGNCRVNNFWTSEKLQTLASGWTSVGPSAKPNTRKRASEGIPGQYRNEESSEVDAEVNEKKPEGPTTVKAGNTAAWPSLFSPPIFNAPRLMPPVITTVMCKGDVMAIAMTAAAEQSSSGPLVNRVFELFSVEKLGKRAPCERK